MSLNNPHISIITVTYNCAESIEETILSVISQSYKNIEYLIIDGGSTDKTIEIIKKYENRISSWISEKDSGIYDAMNKGILRANGEWINFMNSGDKFYNSDTIFEISKNTNNRDVIYGDTILLMKNDLKYLKSKKFKAIKYGMPFCHQSVFVRSEYLKSRPFKLEYKLASDYNFFFQLWQSSNLNYLQLNIPIAIYDNNGASMSILATKEQTTIASKQMPNSIVCFYHKMRLNYYKSTNFMKMNMPKSIIDPIIKIKQKVCNIFQ